MVGVLNGGREGGPCVCLEEREKISRDSATLFLDRGGAPTLPAPLPLFPVMCPPLQPVTSVEP